MRLSLKEIASHLKSGHVAAVPTETVYGLAASIDSPSAIEKIFALKKRPRANPLIIHVADYRAIDEYALKYPPQFESLASAFWPGPLTLILPINDKVPSIVRANLPTAGFRVPALEITRQLIKMTGPLVMPSANLSGKPSATNAGHVEEDFGLHFPVLDGGSCQKGLESTILLFQESRWTIVRRGALSEETFEPILGYRPQFIVKGKGDVPLCPGQHYRHYAPQARLILGGRPTSESFIIGFKERNYPVGRKILLGSLFNPEEVAENLYAALRQLDRENAAEAWVDMDFPREGLWHTIAERLMRAAEK